MKRITPPYSMKITPQNNDQFIYWARFLEDMKRSQMTWGSGSLLEIDYPNVEIMMPSVSEMQEVKEHGNT